MIRPTYTASTYDPGVAYARYVRAGRGPGDFYFFCEVDPVSRLDVRQGVVDRDDVPASIRAAADARYGFFPSYVDWPRV